MKSPMVTNAGYIANKSGYSDLKVMCSGAGWYVGTTYDERNPETGEVIFQEPGSRDSDYFATEAEAQALLKQLESGSDEDAALMLRDHP